MGLAFAAPGCTSSLFYLPNPKCSPRLATAWSRWGLCLGLARRMPGRRRRRDARGWGRPPVSLTGAVSGKGAKPWAKSWLPWGTAGEPRKGRRRSRVYGPSAGGGKGIPPPNGPGANPPCAV
ncbi:hypothetical protein TraAM80_10313 [Trypanosoma rangeli]|uniref:Uncharacterized protein n=1 Tax=Trypanosoma rangeli TaxID=5698 RepID=A0A3R7LDS6_TRYRA|nr:uncharacterized protein TraAM80_10313 [Trypanosoma rangeli]RNE95257.1 hypothetical protein TraAM80_10313 [Trypanosoma rangeli]|eukprot:RNE95257.1 hypothetical protein TraAM80_10313 [Trypanosoma rangeli]